MAKRTGIFEAAKGVWPLPEHVDAAVERAQRIWDEGSRALVYRQDATSRLNEDGLTAALDQILTIGWKLDKMASLYNTNAVNTEVVLFTFVRP